MSFSEIFYNCLIQGNSWQAVLKGLLATVQISVQAVLIGTVIAAGICALRMSKKVFPRVIAQVYIAVLRGSPVLLLLMLMYYVVFANSGFNAVFVATAAFSLNISAHLAELMRSSHMATDHMQVEAARTLGFSKFQAFRLITLPQAAKIAKPMFQSNIVNLIQWTSVVGYVTITDLTRVINNIGSRTMQPLFMICVGVILYLALAYVTYGIFTFSDKFKSVRAKRLEEIT